MTKTVGYTVKTRTGIIIPSWIFETQEEAQEFCNEISERMRPHKHYVFKVEISTTK